MIRMLELFKTIYRVLEKRSVNGQNYPVAVVKASEWMWVCLATFRL